jgi:hypothetical protein
VAAAPGRRCVRAYLPTAGMAPGSIIAAIIAAHTLTKNPNVPSPVSTPMSMPCICVTATVQPVAAIPKVIATERASALFT